MTALRGEILLCSLGILTASCGKDAAGPATDGGSATDAGMEVDGQVGADAAGSNDAGAEQDAPSVDGATGDAAEAADGGSPCSTAEHVQPAHLLGHWSFDLSADDCTGTFGPSTETGGPTTVPGVIGQGRAFDGVDDVITIAGGDALAIGPGAGAITVAAWLRMSEADTSDSGSAYTILCRGRDDAVLFDFRVWSGGAGDTWNDNLQSFWRSSDDLGWCGWVRPADTLLPSPDWRFVAVVVQWNAAGNSRSLFYEDSTDAAGVVHQNGTDCSSSRPIADSSGTLTLGGRLGLDEFFRGDLDEVRVWNAALTAEQLTMQRALDVR